MTKNVIKWTQFCMTRLCIHVYTHVKILVLLCFDCLIIHSCAYKVIKVVLIDQLQPMNRATFESSEVMADGKEWSLQASRGTYPMVQLTQKHSVDWLRLKWANVLPFVQDQLRQPPSEFRLQSASQPPRFPVDQSSLSVMYLVTVGELIHSLPIVKAAAQGTICNSCS